MRRRFLIVSNPLAGSGRRHVLDGVRAALARRGAAVEERGVGAVDSPAALAGAAAGADAIVAAGGDGTVRALAGRTGGLGLPLGLIPAGTGNVLAAEIAMPAAPDEIARVLCEGPAVDLPGTVANGTPFYLMAGIGFDGAVIARLDHATKQRIGKAAYAAPLLAAWLRPGAPFAAEIDGRALTASWIVAARARHYGGRFRLTSAADLRQPGFAAVILRPSGRTRRLAELAALALGRLDQLPGVEVRRCARIEVRAAGHPVQVDGDPLGPSPVVIAAGGSGLRLIVPQGYASMPRV